MTQTDGGSSEKTPKEDLRLIIFRIALRPFLAQFYRQDLHSAHSLHHFIVRVGYLQGSAKKTTKGCTECTALCWIFSPLKIQN